MKSALKLTNLVIVFMLFVAACSTVGTKPSSPVQIDVNFLQAPNPIRDVTVTNSINSSIPVQDVKAQIIIPGEFIIVQGEAEWSFDLDGSKAVEKEIIIN